MQFLLVVLGGACEFFTSLQSIIAFNYCVKHEVNSGIIGVPFPASSIIVAVASYFAYGEKLNIVQAVGLLIVAGGAVVISLFPANVDAHD